MNIRRKVESEKTILLFIFLPKKVFSETLADNLDKFEKKKTIFAIVQLKIIRVNNRSKSNVLFFVDV